MYSNSIAMNPEMEFNPKFELKSKVWRYSCVKIIVAHNHSNKNISRSFVIEMHLFFYNLQIMPYAVINLHDSCTIHAL